MKIKQNYKDDAIVIDAKHFRIIFGENEYNLSEGDDGSLQLLKSKGELDIKAGRRISEIEIKPQSSNSFNFK